MPILVYAIAREHTGKRLCNKVFPFSGEEGRTDKNASKSCRSLYLTDHLGSTRAVVDDAGTVLETFDYYPFGLLMPKRNTANSGTNEKFTGHELDEELGLYHGGARSLDPALGRWLGVDPLADEYPAWSTYNYAKNNPLFYVDPTGRNPVCGDENNCDEVYQEGAIVENNRGRWEYLGNNVWKDLEYNQTQSAESLNMVFTSELDRLDNSKITQYEPNFFGGIKERIDNSSFVTRTVLGGFYNSIDALYIYGSLQRGRSKRNLSGELVSGSELTDRMVDLVSIPMGEFAKAIPVKGLNAAEFSSLFKGTPVTRLQPATRGAVNRVYNKAIHKNKNSILLNSMMLNISLIDNDH